MSMKRLLGSVWIAIACILPALDAWGQSPPKRKYPRAEFPRFNREEVDRVFFDDVFSHLVGARPKRDAAATAGLPTPAAANSGREAVPASVPFAWSQVISSLTIEDEIKSLKLDLDRVVTTPSEFAGRGYKAARLDFSLLTVLFAIIDEYDTDVRWKESAAQARYAFARTAANLKAGGSIQVYNESKLRKQDLDDLVRGAKLAARESGVETTGEGLVDRAPLMQVLETRLEAHLKQWTAAATEFRAESDKIRHEAELVAAIGMVLLSGGMDDADDAEYRRFAESLKQGGRRMAEAAKSLDESAARQAMTEISRSCTDCHEGYR